MRFFCTEEVLAPSPQSDLSMRIESGSALLMFAAGASDSQSRSCHSVGGMLMINLGADDANTTMGYATGDLKGAVGATILNIEAQNNGATLIFTVQHHWVTESGHTLAIDPAKPTVEQVGGPQSTRYGVVSYPVHLRGGTGRFAGATGDFNNIGEANLVTGQLVFRSSGTVCFTQKD
jgi:hypothetical protein